MITEARIREDLKDTEGLDWITALTNVSSTELKPTFGIPFKISCQNMTILSGLALRVRLECDRQKLRHHFPLKKGRR